MIAEAMPRSAALPSTASSHHDGALGPLDPEAFLAHVLGVQKSLQRLGRVQPIQNVQFLYQPHRGAYPLHLLLYPLLLIGILDMHVLHAHRPAVGIAEYVQDLSQRHLAVGLAHVDAAQAGGEELPIEVPDGQAIGGRVELGMHLGLVGRKRVEVGDEVAPHPVHVDERVHLHLLGDHRLLRSRGRMSGRQRTAS